MFTNPMPTLTALSDYYGRRYRAQQKGTVEPKLKHIKERLALPPDNSPSEILDALYKSHTGAK